MKNSKQIKLRAVTQRPIVELIQRNGHSPKNSLNLNFTVKTVFFISSAKNTSIFQNPLDCTNVELSPVLHLEVRDL